MKKFYGGINLDLYTDIPKEYQSILHIGKNCIIGSGTILAGNGFGYEKTNKRIWKHKDHKKKLIINEGVTIHYNCVLDRGRVRNTIIGSGCKLDSHVHIAHGVQIKYGCLIGSGTRILGSVNVGINTIIWSGCIINQGVVIGDNCVIGAGTYLRHNVPDNTQVYIKNGKLISKHLN